MNQDLVTIIFLFICYNKNFKWLWCYIETFKSTIRFNNKLHHSNLLRNDVYIEYYQNNYRDFDIGQPKYNLKKKVIKTIEKMKSKVWIYDDKKDTMGVSITLAMF